jgi:hypothetical protein
VLTEHEFDVPLDHGAPDGQRITVFAREAADPDGHDRPLHGYDPGRLADLARGRAWARGRAEPEFADVAISSCPSGVQFGRALADGPIRTDLACPAKLSTSTVPSGLT